MIRGERSDMFIRDIMRRSASTGGPRASYANPSGQARSPGIDRNCNISYDDMMNSETYVTPPYRHDAGQDPLF